jgi:hypothetical protein
MSGYTYTAARYGQTPAMTSGGASKSLANNVAIWPVVALKWTVSEGGESPTGEQTDHLPKGTNMADEGIADLLTEGLLSSQYRLAQYYRHPVFPAPIELLAIESTDYLSELADDLLTKVRMVGEMIGTVSPSVMTLIRQASLHWLAAYSGLIASAHHPEVEGAHVSALFCLDLLEKELDVLEDAASEAAPTNG